MRQLDKPRIILWDLETLPNLNEVLKIYPSLSDYPGLTLKATTCSIICAGWKLLDDKKTHCINAWDFPEWKNDVNNDYEVVKRISDILNDADAVVTHNGKRFDWKFLQTRLLLHNLPPLKQINHIDTCSLAKSNLLSFNNRLNTLARHFTDKEKMEHEGWNLWVKVHGRDEKAMKVMEKYCKQDVIVLEDIFKILRPFAKMIPNHNLFHADDGCPYCGSLKITKSGTRPTKTTIMQRYFCHDCRGHSQSSAKGKITA